MLNFSNNKTRQVRGLMIRGVLATLVLSAVAGCATSAEEEFLANQALMQGSQNGDIGVEAIHAASAAYANYAANPKDPVALVAYSKSLRQIGTAEKALNVLSSVNDLLEQHPEVGIELVKVQLAINKNQGAETSARRLLNFFPQNDVLRQLLGTSLARQNAHAAAQNIFADLVQRQPDNRVLLNNYAMSLMMTRKLADARDLLEHAVSLPGSGSRTRQNYALVLGLMGDLAASREVLLRDLPSVTVDKNLQYIASLAGLDPPAAQSSFQLDELAIGEDDVSVKTAPVQGVSTSSLTDPEVSPMSDLPTTASISNASEPITHASINNGNYPIPPSILSADNKVLEDLRSLSIATGSTSKADDNQDANAVLAPEIRAEGIDTPLSASDSGLLRGTVNN